jgi:diguanylate cyclase (GGDEF)-like protein
VTSAVAFVPTIPRVYGLLLSAGLVITLGLVEAHTPSELSFGGLYFLPVALAAWSGGISWGIVAALGTAADWFVADLAISHSVDRLGLRVWTAVNHFAAYSFLAWMVDRLRRTDQELSAANASLQEQTLTDPLTGLRNRRYLDFRIKEDVALVLRSHRHSEDPARARPPLDLIFLVVDVDHFKNVNDIYGHHIGDALLQQMAAVLLSATRDTDTILRWGGEEFLVVARNTNRNEAAAMAERIRSAVEQHTFEVGTGVPIRKTCSLGFSVFPFAASAPEACAWEQVVDLVDHCMYAAKRAGRNAWVGIGPAADFSASELPEHLATEAPRLLRGGRLLVQSSLPPGQRLEWASGDR